MYFVNTNLPEERVRVLLSEIELSKLPVHSLNIFKKPNIDCYMERPNATFCNGKDRALNNFYYGEFLVITHLKVNQIRRVSIRQMN